MRMWTREAVGVDITAGDASDEGHRFAMPPLLVSVEDAARLLAVGRTTVYELIAAGELEAINIGRCRRVPLTALHAFVQQRRR
jgi:excisionase family DNA binding protein